MPYELEKGMDDKQEAILNYIKEYQATSGHAPSVSEIVLETGMGISAVNSYLEQLERAGYIEQNRFGIKLAVPTPLGNYLPRGNHLTTDRKLRVFLCHASQDKPVVRELYQRLLAEGWIDPWLDEEKLLPGQDWDLEIEKAVEAADVVVACLSSNSVSKEGYIQRELKFVLDIALEKPEGTIFIIPLRLDDCQLPRRLRSWQYVDFFPENRTERALIKILQSLEIRRESLGIRGAQGVSGNLPAPAWESNNVPRSKTQPSANQSAKLPSPVWQKLVKLSSLEETAKKNEQKKKD